MRMREILLATPVAFVVACGGDPEPPIQDGSEVDAAVYEGCPASTPPFQLGMRASGEAGKVLGVLLDAEPNPPMRYRNDWSVRFEDAQAQALDDVEITEARPFMPVHGHDGNVRPTVTRNLDGTYRIDGLNLNMRGPWEIQLRVNSGSLGSDYIVFHVCVVE